LSVIGRKKVFRDRASTIIIRKAVNSLSGWTDKRGPIKPGSLLSASD
jgi:hypothetical protein